LRLRKRGPRSQQQHGREGSDQDCSELDGRRSQRTPLGKTGRELEEIYKRCGK